MVGSGGPGGDGGAAGTPAFGPQVFGIECDANDKCTLSANTVGMIDARSAVVPGGFGGTGGTGGNGGDGFTAGPGGPGGRAGQGGNGSQGGLARGILLSSNSILTNNLVYSIYGGAGAPGGYGGNGGNGGDGGSGFFQGNGGDGGDGATGGRGGGNGSALGVSFLSQFSAYVILVNNTIAQVFYGEGQGAGGLGGFGGSGGSGVILGLDGNDGAAGAAGQPGETIGLHANANSIKLVNNILALSPVGRSRPAGLFGITIGVFSFDPNVVFIADYNDVYGWEEQYLPQTLLLGRHSISADPKFLNVNSANFRLNSSSPAINAGAKSFPGVTIPAYDILNIARPQGTGVDLGAYEFILKLFAPLIYRSP